MLISEKVANERVNSPSNLSVRFGRPPAPTSEPHVEILPNPRAGKRPELPGFLKTTMAILHQSGAGTQAEVAEVFGTTQAEVSHIENGRSDKGLDKGAIEAAQSEIRDVAMKKLLGTLGLLTEDKISKCKAGEISTIAANLSRVVEKTLPKDTGPGSGGVNITIYAPQPRDEKSYKTLEV